MESHIRDQLYWGAGLLDGDGSVGIYSKWLNLCVSVGKAENGYSSLYELKRLFGGIIVKNKDADEKGQATQSWVLNGVKALDFCKIIHPYVQLKKPQFFKATEFPLNEKKGFNRSLTEEIKNKRTEIATYLKNEKHIEHAVINDELPNSYYAGMFDSDGTISITGFNQVKVSLNQKYKAICDNLAQKFTGGIQKTKDRDIYIWSIGNKDGCFNFLNSILPYSIEKKPQIEIVLNMKCNDAQNVKKAIEKLKGLQGIKMLKERNLTPQKKLDGLPKYISYMKREGNKVGYVVQYKGYTYRVGSQIFTMKEKLELSLEKLEEFKNKPIKKNTEISKLKVVYNEDLPEHFRQVERDGEVIGYSIRYNGRKTRCTDKKKTLEQKFELMQEQLKKFQDM